MAGREPAAELLIADVHRAVEREIADPRFRLLRIKHRRSEIRSAIALGIGKKRQVGELAIDIVGWRRAGLRQQWYVPDLRRVGQLAPLAAEILGLDTEDLGDPLARCI